MNAEITYQLIEITKYYQEKMILNIPKLEINTGEIFAIVGPSGSGKSTLLRLLDFVESPTTGSIKLYGKELHNSILLADCRKIGMLFQSPELLNGSVMTNIEFPLKIRNIKSSHKLDEVIKRLSLSSLVQADAKNLSGGETQRVALARVLVTSPKILLLDEPTANLDPYHVEIIEATISSLKQAGVTVILVTHNVFQARRIADKIGLLINGEFIEVADRTTFFDNPNDQRVKDFVEGKTLY